MLQPEERRFARALVLGVSSAAFALVICSCVAHALRSDGLDTLDAWLRSFAIGIAGSIGICVGANVWHRRVGLDTLHLSATSVRWVTLALAAIPVLFTLHYGVSNMLVATAPALPVTARTEPVLPPARDYQALVLALLTTGLLHPLLEEILFRRYVFRLLLDFGPPSALVVSSVAFGALHGWSRQAVLGIAAGFVYGWLYYRSGSLVPAVIAHVGLNTLVILLHFFVLAG